MIAQCYEAELMKKLKNEEAKKQTTVMKTVVETTFDAAPSEEVCTVFDVKDKTNMCIRM